MSSLELQELLSTVPGHTQICVLVAGVSIPVKFHKKYSRVGGMPILLLIPTPANTDGNYDY